MFYPLCMTLLKRNLKRRGTEMYLNAIYSGAHEHINQLTFDKLCFNGWLSQYNNTKARNRLKNNSSAHLITNLFGASHNRPLYRHEIILCKFCLHTFCCPLALHINKTHTPSYNKLPLYLHSNENISEIT